MKLGETCKHGGLRRCCELCDCTEQITELERILKKAIEVIEFYGDLGLWNMTSYRTAKKIYNVEQPENVEISGSPVINDKGDKARAFLEEMENEIQKKTKAKH